MYKHLALVGAITITGCSVDNSGYCGEINTYDKEMTDSTGIVLEPGGDMYVSFETVSRLYQDTQACMGMTAPAPTVAYIDFRQRIGSIGGWGVYIVSGQVVWLNTAIDEYIPRNCASDIETLKHEYVHHILHLNIDDASGHSSPMFATCGPGPYVKDGVPVLNP